MLSHGHLLGDIGKSILAAAFLGLPAYFVGIPLILAYLAAGMLLGPNFGLGLVQSAESISVLSEIGLVLLMFILGLEIDLKMIKQAGKPVLVNGITQFVGCALGGYFIFSSLNLNGAFGSFEVIYLAIACALSSTLIVVKILSERMTLNTLPSRITVGILIIQDLWAISFLAIQPNLSDLSPAILGSSFFKAGMLVMVSWLLAKYVLPVIFARAGKQPELLLVIAMSWCFAISGLAGYFQLSKEMGALIAGVSVAAFPYHIDVMAKLSSLRDFFVTLFFVSLGLQIPVPNSQVLMLSLVIILFVIVSRVLTIFPVLYFLKYGNRTSLLPALNLSQLSEFALVLGTLGVSYGHINQDLVSAFTIAMVATALLSSLLMPLDHTLYRAFTFILEKLGFKDHVGTTHDSSQKKVKADIVLLGFYREASSLLQEMITRYSKAALDKVLVVDFNPEAHQKLKKLGIHCYYGDISHIDTLRHLDLDKSELLIVTIPDQSLKGITNLKLLHSLKKMAPHSKVIVTAETIESAVEMYNEGAHYVYIPRLVGAYYLVDVLERIKTSDSELLRKTVLRHLDKWKEVLP